MPHFFVPPENVREGRFVLEKDEAQHVALVLRKKAGDEIQLFDGKGHGYRGRIESVSTSRVEGRVLAAQPQEERPPLALRLFQGLPKGDKFDWILEKMTELGASEIVPVYTERGEVRVPPQKLADRVKRWEKIVLAAAKQSGRSHLPRVSAPVSLVQALSSCGADSLTLFPWEGEGHLSLKQALASRKAGTRTVNVFIGPEGGFAPSEADLARKSGALSVTLGPVILRTETAGLFVASVLLYEWEA